jgi:hypothetical protein
VRLGEGEARAWFADAAGNCGRQGQPYMVAVTFAVDGDTICTAVD